MSEEKLTQEELNYINTSKDESQNIILTLGQIHVERINLQSRLDELNSLQTATEQRLRTLVANEESFTKKLFEKYGDAIVDVESGTIKRNS
jgi:capsule polysaccharide export protein KpsE/RkpR